MEQVAAVRARLKQRAAGADGELAKAIAALDEKSAAECNIVSPGALV